MILVHKAGDKGCPSNYRPISVLPAFSKILEAVIKSRIMSFLTKNSIFCDKQHRFLSGRSTGTALTELFSAVARAFDEGEKCGLSACDLSKAFDSIDHVVLLSKLNYYGIRGVALDLMKSYLTNRTQRVLSDDETSNTERIEFGVPQGSILEPLLFLVYMSDLPSNVSAEVEVIFADDASFLRRGQDALTIQNLMKLLLLRQNYGLMRTN